VLYYPFVDGDGGLQATTNTLTNRYDGDGCHIMLVSQGIGIATTGQTTIVYVDKDDATRNRVKGYAPSGTFKKTQTLAKQSQTQTETQTQKPGLMQYLSLGLGLL
jgi:hypothetical protein